MKDLNQVLNKVDKPGRYIGGENNSVVKKIEDMDVHFAFAFPDLYEIGMSYVGLQILYYHLNKEKNVFCERVFAPALDMEEKMKDGNIPLFSLETKTPLKEFHMVGFTLQYEMSFTNILNMLDLGGIPRRAWERTEEDPIIIAGGPCAFNPEPMAPFFDIFLIGDGEELLPTLARLYKKGEKKEDFLKRAMALEGVYVPSFYEPIYKEDHTVKEYKKLVEEAPFPIKRCILPSIEEVEFPENPIVPLVEVAQDRAVVETFRGCTRGCRFCQAGMIYRPVRERSPETIKRLAEGQLKASGHEELSLLSLSTSDYSQFEDLATDLMGMCRDQNVSLSLPSLRLDTFSFKVLSEIQSYKKSGLTFAPEAGTQRMRDAINKNITHEDVMNAMEQAITLGWKRIKLYFMIGLPGETMEDVLGIAKLAKEIMDLNYQLMGRNGGRFSLTVSVSNFVPKPYTPYQWVGQDKDFIDKHNALSTELRKIKGVRFNYHDSPVSVLEALLARGDRKVADLIDKAVTLGCKFDGWSEHFHWDLWEKALEETNTSIDFYARRVRPTEEYLPWDILETGISKKYLMKEWDKSIEAMTTPDCREHCTGCGINRFVVCPMEGSNG